MSEPRYLNVDLVVHSDSDLTPLALAFGESVFVLGNEKYEESYRAVFETITNTNSANEAIELLCNLIDTLEGTAKSLWASAQLKEFDIGFESGKRGKLCFSALPASTIKRVAELGASISITVYSESPDEPSAT